MYVEDMVEQNQKKPVPNKQQTPAKEWRAVPLPRENPFRAISKMFHASVGKLPAHLVIIFVVALACAVMAGTFLKLEEPNPALKNAYLVQRIQPDAGQPALTESNLEGVWAHESAQYITTLRIGKGVFEILSRYKPNPVSRHFLRGGYKSDGNVLIMQQRKDLGTPFDPNHLDYKFFPLNFSDVNLFAQNDGRTMVWKTPPREKARVASDHEELLDSIFGEDFTWVKIAATP